MFQIPQRQYWSCMGETVLKKSQYDADAANARENNRSYADQLSRQQTQQQLRVTLPSQTQSPFVLTSQAPPQPPDTPAQRFIQTLAQNIVRPFVLIQTALQNAAQQVSQAISQTLQQVPGFIDKAMSQVLSFFFGYKKDTREEKEKRDRNDAASLGMFGESDLFGTSASKVEQKENSGMGSGSRQ